MKIKAKVIKTYDTGNVKAVCDLMFDDAFVVHGVKLIGKQNGEFVSMPSDIWKNAQGEIKRIDIAHPLESETRQQIFNAVVDAYETYVQHSGIGESPLGIRNAN